MKNQLFDITSKCRVCSGSLKEIFFLGEQALTGIFPKNANTELPSGPVTLVRCTNTETCGLVQLRETYSLERMYGETYGYRTGLNDSMVKHIYSKVRDLEAAYPLSSGDLCIDVGSNDGTGLSAYQTPGLDLLGVDPSGTKFRHLYPKGSELLPEFFSAPGIYKVRSKKRAKLITCYSMFYDLPDPIQFAKDVKVVLAEDGIWELEQSYLPSMLKRNSFDTICQEHLEYYSLRTIELILAQADLKVLDVRFNYVNGGSFSVRAGHPSLPICASAEQRLVDARAAESVFFESGLDVFAEFRSRIEAQKQITLDFLVKCRDAGHFVAGIGASTKGNVLLQYFGIDRGLLPVIAEVNSDKFGSYTPGSKIPIRDQDEVLAEKPDFLLILPWHFKPFFERAEAFRGLSRVYPLPVFEICD